LARDESGGILRVFLKLSDLLLAGPDESERSDVAALGARSAVDEMT